MQKSREIAFFGPHNGYIDWSHFKSEASLRQIGFRGNLPDSSPGGLQSLRASSLVRIVISA